MKIAVINGKGGSGKTTLSILLGSALSEAGHVVAVEDRDPQQTATRWIAEAGGPEVFDSSKAYSAVLIDTPPRLDAAEVIDAMRSADILLVVSSPSPADLFTSRDTVEVLARERCLSKARIVFNQVVPKTVLSRELDEFAARIGLPALKSRVQRRQCYQHAVIGGWKMLPPEARDEVFRVALEVAALPRESMTVGV